MPRVTPEQLAKLQEDSSCIRNICILAHVDHGKTSLSDSLLAANGIISQRMAGKVRYLDSRPDEQLRGITMESSAISLYFRVLRRNRENPELEPEVNEHLINLIDSPGHIDFSSEVSTASRLCDGAVVLVDVVEGVCSQTVTVLRQSWVDNLKPILVLNKIDRLITELKLTPQEAYIHLTKVIEQVNSVIGSFFAGERMQDDYLYRERVENLKDGEKHEEYVEKDDEDLYFHPEKNNVIFASAIDGWGFNISQFAAFYEKKLGMKRENLQKALWGDFYIDPKAKKIITGRGLKGRNLKPLFVSFVLDNIWRIYEDCLLDRNQESLEKIVKSLGIKILPRDLRSKDTKVLLQSIFGQWLPVSTAVLLTVVEKLPSPAKSQQSRIPTILANAPGSELLDQKLEEAMLKCDRFGPVSAYVSKIVSIPEAELPRNRRVAMTTDEMMERGRIAREAAARAAEEALKHSNEKAAQADGDEEEAESGNGFEDEFEWEADFETDEPAAEIELPKEELIGFARIYSGSLKVGQQLTVLGPKYDPSRPEEFTETVEISELYLMMGRDLVSLDEVPAGNIVGIGGLAGKILKNGTLVSPGIIGVNLAGITLTSPPIVRVALEPVNPMQIEQLERGLQLLNMADPCVQVFLQDSGEHILATAGELHLERCLKDLRERFAGIEISSSQPEIPFRETIVQRSEMNPAKSPELGRGVVEFQLGKYAIRIRVRPLPEQATAFLMENRATIDSLVNSGNRTETSAEDDLEFFDSNNAAMDKDRFVAKLQDLLVSANNDNKRDGFKWDSYVSKIAAFGSKRTGPNLLFDESGDLTLLFGDEADRGNGAFEYHDSVLNGFQLATHAGPLAQEVVQGLAVFVESVSVEQADVEAGSEGEAISNMAGRLLTMTRDSIHKAFLDWSPRLMLAMYSCEIQASAEVLGKVYAVVQRRRGRIESEEMKEGTPFFSIKAQIPAVEAFGFGEDIRKRTSGAAQPQLVYAGFEIVDQDPFWVPTTEEELEELGEFADRENIARKYMNQIRRRKGLFVDEKVVKNAEKQRTLKKD